MNSGPGYRKLEHDYLKLRLRYPRERIRVVDHHDGHAAPRLLSVALRRGGRARRRLARVAAEHADAVSLPRRRRARARARQSSGASGASTRWSPDRCCPTDPKKASARRWGWRRTARRIPARCSTSSRATRACRRTTAPSSAVRRSRASSRRACGAARTASGARSVFRARGVRRPAGVRAPDGADGRVRLREDRQPQSLHRGRHRAERSGQRTRAAAIAVRECVDPSGLLRHRALAWPGALGLFPGRRRTRARSRVACR